MDTVKCEPYWTISVDIHNEDDWNLFYGLANWFQDDAPIEMIKKKVLDNLGWVCFMMIDDYFDLMTFMCSDEWNALRDSGLAVTIKKNERVNEEMVRKFKKYSL